MDVAINGGRVIDPRTKTSRMINIGIIGNQIVATSIEPIVAKETIDATGLVVAPGFIDPHGHVDGNSVSGELSACQGITTTVGGNCGLSPLHIGRFIENQTRDGFIINQAELIGHSFTLRETVGATDPRKYATDQQIEEMIQLAQRGLEEGAVGISLGLDYSPSVSLREIKAMAMLCKKYNRILPVHTRLFTLYDLFSIKEMLYIAKETGVTLLFSHFVYQYGEGVVTEALHMVDNARRNGINVSIDSGLYIQWATYIGTATFDPQSMRDNELRLQDMLVATGPHKGKWLDEELFSTMRTNHTEDTVIYFTGNEAEVYESLTPNYSMPSTDIAPYNAGEGHPQIAGSFPKYFRKMVNELKILTLEEAVYRATLAPAQLFSFTKKGVLDVGYDADVVIFDPDEIRDNADFPDRGSPDAKPSGIKIVMVNGQIAIKDNIATGNLAGTIVKV